MNLRQRSERLIARLEPAGGEDCRRILDAAAALDVREFDLFRLAWRHWHGSEPDPARLEAVFAAYMFQRRIPPWARQFSRDVLRLRGNGTLDPAKFGADTVRRPQARPRHAGLAVIAVAAVTCLFVALLIAAPNDPVNGPRPGCLAASASPLAAATARLFTGRAEPFTCR